MSPYLSDMYDLYEVDKVVEVADGFVVPATQAGKVDIEMHNDNEELFTAVLHNVLYVPALAERLFSIESLMEAGHE